MSWSSFASKEPVLEGGDEHRTCGGMLQLSGIPGKKTATCLRCGAILDAQTGAVIHQGADMQVSELLYQDEFGNDQE